MGNVIRVLIQCGLWTESGKELSLWTNLSGMPAQEAIAAAHPVELYNKTYSLVQNMSLSNCLSTISKNIEMCFIPGLHILTIQ